MFDNGEIKFSGVPATTVPLGEIRSDTDNHLIVIGGFGKSASPVGTGISSYWGNKDWYDDVSDGPVTATIKLRADSSTPPVIGAWVIVGPPKFAPHQQSVITLYDRLQQAMISGNLIPGPTTTSYTNDVFPILQRARDTRWVQDIFGAHTWPDPVIADPLRNAIFDRLKVPGGGADCLCRLLACLLQRDSVISGEFEKRLREFGISFEHARKCVEAFCRCQTRRD